MDTSVLPWPSVIRANMNTLRLSPCRQLQRLGLPWAPVNYSLMQPCPFHQGMPYYILALHFSFFMPPFLYFLLLASDEHLPVSSSELPCYLGFDEPADPLTIPSFTEVPWRILYPLSCISFCPTITKARVLLHVNLFIPCLLLSTQTKLHGAKILFAPRVQMYWLNDYYMTKLIRA